MPNRADEGAMELALRLQEKQGGEITVVSIAPPEAEETLMRVVGMGAGAFLRVWSETLAEADAFGVSLALAVALRRLNPDLVLCGERAAGGLGSGLTGPLLAERLGWPLLTGAVHLDTDTEGRLVTAQRLIERGDRMILQAPLPAVVTAAPESPTPRYPAPAKARRAAHTVLDLENPEIAAETLRAFPMLPTVEWTVARPRPKKLFTPPSTASAADRLRMVMGGGMQKKAQDNLVEAPPDKAAEQILQFLRQEKVIE
jgi:electron transfer flavoprotein beta subunit